MQNSLKYKIQQKFNAAAKSYDQSASIQNEVAKQAITTLLLHQQVFQYIADFACGTGESTRHLAEHIQYKACYAIDFANQLLACAKTKFTGNEPIHWLSCDFDKRLCHLPLLDLIFCNMGLQWAANFSKTISLWNEYLKPNGLLLFSLPLATNFPEIRHAFKPHFLSHEQLLSACTLKRFTAIDTQHHTFQLQFSSALAALRYLKATGTNHNDTPTRKGLTTPRLTQIFHPPKTPQTLTYEIGIYLFRKTT